MTSATREIVGSCISFIKVYCKAMPSPMVASSLPLIVRTLYLFFLLQGYKIFFRSSRCVL
jgi:hypothetical protein